MTYSTLRQHRLFRPALGSVLAAVSGLLLWVMPLGDAWTQASYDYLFRFGACAATNPVVVVLLDNEAYAELGQNRGQPWDRALHARLFNRLADDGCALVVPDIVFRQAGERSVDQAMAGALHRLPRLVLAAGQA